MTRFELTDWSGDTLTLRANRNGDLPASLCIRSGNDILVFDLDPTQLQALTIEMQKAAASS